LRLGNNPKSLLQLWAHWEGGGHTFPPRGCLQSRFPVLSGFAEISIIYFITNLFCKILLKGMKKKEKYYAPDVASIPVLS